jgi:hypothetical protein
VGLKKEYNNAAQGPAARAHQQQQQRGGGGGEGGAAPRLLSGEQWYSQQAFRALNQVCAAAAQATPPFLHDSF